MHTKSSAGPCWEREESEVAGGAPKALRLAQPRAQSNWRRERANTSSRARNHPRGIGRAQCDGNCGVDTCSGCGEEAVTVLHHRVRLVVLGDSSPDAHLVRVTQSSRLLDCNTFNTSTEFKNDSSASMQTGIDSWPGKLTKSFPYTGFVTGVRNSERLKDLCLDIIILIS